MTTTDRPTDLERLDALRVVLTELRAEGDLVAEATAAHEAKAVRVIEAAREAGVPMTEIAQRLGLSRNTAYRRIGIMA